MKPEDPSFQSFISDLLTKSDLSRSKRIFAWLSASVALYDHRMTRFFIELAFENQQPVLKVKEVILQSHLFCGFPNAIEGLIVLNRVLHDRGLSDDNFVESRDEKEVIQDGLDLCQRIYGKNYDKLIKNMEHISSDISKWMVADGYGKVLSRPILTPAERELSVIAALAVLERERQLVSHIRGAVHVGASYDEIFQVISGLTILIPEECVQSAFDILKKALP